MAKTVFKTATLLIPSGPFENPNKKHLFVVCTDECAKGKRLIVPICTWLNNLCDPTCKISAHEHSFINRPSYVLYRNCRIELHSRLVKGIDEGVFVTRDPINAQTFLRIANGFCKSVHTPRYVKNYLNCPKNQDESDDQ